MATETADYKYNTAEYIYGATLDKHNTSFVNDAVDEMMTYEPWNEEQVEQGTAVREALSYAYKQILTHVPPSYSRTEALKALQSARLWANTAITFAGRW